MNSKLSASGILFSLTASCLGGELPPEFAEDDTSPTVEIGAQIFSEHCVLCHGSQGMGEGAIPLKIKGYPDTNLAVSKKTKTRKEIFSAITMGSILPNINEFMPPMGNELTWTEITSVSMFISGLREQPDKHIKMLMSVDEHNLDIDKLGKKVYETRCVLCHGVNGEGDGRMARVIKKPPPFNLTLGVLPPDYLTKIISQGGESMGRSPKMPPWGEQLSQKEIEAVVNYIILFRNQ